MSLLSLIVLLVVLAVLMWAINAYIPMQDTLKKILNIVVVIAVCLFLLNLAGLLPDLNAIRVGR